MTDLLIPLGGLSLHHILLAFAGGVFGAAIGALPAFILCGLFVIIGVALMTAGAGTDFLLIMGFGYVFGPHVSFTAGVCASAYAASKKKLDSGRDIVTSLMGVKSLDVLLVGGLFGVLGAVLVWVFLTLMPYNWKGLHWTDAIALTVVVTQIIARLMFSKSGLFGKVAEGEKRFSPTEKSALWLPWQTTALENLVIGLGAGLLSSYIMLLLGDKGGVYLGFGISAISLFFLQMGFKVPVTHHITLVAAGATLASGGSLIWGTLFGIGSAFAGHLWACVFTIHTDTHIDPPAAAIATMWGLLVAFGALGVYTLIPLP